MLLQGVSINKSLLFLKQCIHDLSQGTPTKSFRNSTLTRCQVQQLVRQLIECCRLLEPSLSGGAAVALICNMTPVAADFKVPPLAMPPLAVY